MPEPIIIGPFVVENRLAAGGMGVVYSCRHASGQPAALKLLDMTGDDGSFSRLFVREVEATARLHHDNVVAVLDYGVLAEDQAIETFGPGTPYYVMEYVPGGSLHEKPPEDWATLHAVLEQVLLGLAHAHARGVIHRDIKPPNILIDDSATVPRYVLTDFGIAHAMDMSMAGAATDDPNRERASGTPLFMAPEQFLGTWRDYGPWTDLYALGTVAWSLACGRPPYKSKSYVELAYLHLSQPIPAFEPRFAVPDWFAKWLERMTEKAPRHRYPSAAAALAALRRQAADVPGWRNLTRAQRSTAVHGAGLGILGMRHVPIEGREDERDQLWSRLLEARAGSFRLVRLEGPPGVGKSRLARWLYHVAGEAGAALCFRADSRHPAGGLASLLHAVFRSDGLTGVELTERIDHVTRELGLQVEPRVLADLLSPEGQGLSADQGFEATARLLEELSRDQAVLVWIDDLDESDELERFLEYVGRRLEGAALLVVATARPHAAAPAGQRPAPQRWSVELAPLSDPQLEAIIRSQVRLPWEITAKILERCGGSPDYALQLVAHWAERGALEVEGDRFVLREQEEPGLPPDVEALLHERLSAFADCAALHIAAALGSTVDVAEWQAVCAELGIAPEPRLVADLVRHGLAVRGDSGFTFANRIIRELILEDAPEDVVLVHRACAKVLRSLYGAGDSALSLRIARHLLDGAAPIPALFAARNAAEAAQKTYDVVALLEATRIWEICADTAGIAEDNPQRLDLSTMRAYALLLRPSTAERDEAAALLARAAEVAARADDTDVALRVAARRAVGSLYLGEVRERVRELEAALSGATDRTSLAEGHLALARSRAAIPDVAGMLEAATAALELSTDDAQVMQAQQVRARALLELGRLEEARDAIDEANEVARRRNWLLAEARGLETRGFIADSACAYAEAADFHRRSLALFELVAPLTTYPDKEREYLARALLAARQWHEAREQIAAVRLAVDAGKVGFYTHIEDVELALAAQAGMWQRFDEILPAALKFDDFAPYNLHRRALAVAVELTRTAGQHERATSLARAFEDLCGAETELALREARRILD